MGELLVKNSMEVKWKAFGDTNQAVSWINKSLKNTKLIVSMFAYEGKVHIVYKDI